MIEKADLIAGCASPEDANTRRTDSSVGLLVLFGSAADMDKSRGQFADQYHPESVKDFVDMQGMIREVLDRIPLDETGKSYALSRTLYLKTEEDLQAKKTLKTNKQSEYRRAVTALKSLRTTDSWLNRENARQINKVTAMEREVRDYADARHKEEQKIQDNKTALEQLDHSLMNQEEVIQKLDHQILSLQQDLGELDRQVNAGNRVFQHARWVEWKAQQDSKRIELKQFQDTHLDSELALKKLQEERTQLSEALAASDTEITRLEQARSEAAKNLIKARQGYAGGEKMFADSQDRIHELEKRIRGLEAPLAQSEIDYNEALKRRLPSAFALLQGFVACSYTYRAKLNEIASLNGKEECTAGMISTVLFLVPALMASGTNAAEFFKSQKEDIPSVVFLADDQQTDKCFPYQIIFA